MDLAGQLHDLGQNATLLRSELPDGAARDLGLQAELFRSGCEIVTLACGAAAQWHQARQKAGLVARAKRVAPHAMWPDHWAALAVRGAKWIRDGQARFDAVISSRFPWTNHLVGHEAAQSGTPWSADYRDPWGLREFNGVWKPTTEHLAQLLVLKQAAGLVVTTASTLDLFSQHFAGSEVRTLPAGASSELLPRPPSNQPITFLQGGTASARAYVSPFPGAIERARADLGPIGLLGCRDLYLASERASAKRVANRLWSRIDHRQLRGREVMSHVVVGFGNSRGIRIPGKDWRALSTGRLLNDVLADDKDPFATFPELERRAVAVPNDEAAIAHGREERVRRPRVGLWQSLESLPPARTWCDRADSLMEFVHRRVAVARARPRPGWRPSATLSPTIGTISGLKPPWLWERASARR